MLPPKISRQAALRIQAFVVLKFGSMGEDVVARGWAAGFMPQANAVDACLSDR